MVRKVIDNPILSRVPQNDREQVRFMKELDNYIVATFNELSGQAAMKQLPTTRISGKGSVQDVDPLTSVVSGATATIDVAAHTVQIGADLISYNGGALLGLNQDSLYYVYAEDPNYEGGAVAYYATEDRQEISADPGRYYVGSIWTARDELPGAITSVTQANPAYVTCANNFASGDEVDIDGVVGMTELNGNRYTIHNVTPGGFNLKDTDSTAFTAYVSGGAATFVAQGTAGGGGGGGTFPGTSPLP